MERNIFFVKHLRNIPYSVRVKQAGNDKLQKSPRMKLLALLRTRSFDANAHA